MLVLVAENSRKLVLYEIKSDLQTDLGVVKKEKLKAAKPGDVLKSHLGKKFYVINPAFLDVYESMKRGPQIITLKDAAYIAGVAGVRNGYRIVDAGVGTGALAVFLAMSCAPKGVVYSYEVEDRFIKVAQENTKRAGLSNLKIKKRNVYSGITEKNLDLITLDLSEPWRVNPAGLKAGGFLVAYVPNINQVQRFVKETRNKGFQVLEVTELIKRNWVVKGQVLRPENMMLGHTGFLVVCRKVI
jgi:tRNA (adenine57-N1/adenine58-N1)-methyltransferase